MEPLKRDSQGNPTRRLHTPQFSLRTVFVFVTVCCIVFAMARGLPPYLFLSSLLILSTVLAHVFGAFIGSKLGMQSRTTFEGPTPFTGGSGAETEAHLAILEARNSRERKGNLGERRPLGLRAKVASAFGGALGMIFGPLAAALWYQERAEWPSLLLAGFALGPLFALAVFLIWGFFKVAWSALQQSIRESKPNPALGSASLREKQANPPSERAKKRLF